MPVVISTLFLMLVLAFGVMSVVALPQLLAGKTIFSQGLDQVDLRRRAQAAQRRRAAGEADAGVSFGPDLPTPKVRLRTPIGWSESSPGPRHAR